MAKIKLQGNASGTGVLTVTAPNTSTDRTITLPDATATLATTDINSFTGDTTITSGDIIFATAGKGICLGVTSNTDANTLDDYEEGTWTPVLKGSSTDGEYTYDANRTGGRYTKIGNTVTAYGAYRVSSVVTAATGDAEIHGLPFTSNVVTNAVSSVRVPGPLLIQAGPTLASSSYFNWIGASATKLGIGLHTTSGWSSVVVTDADYINSIWAFSLTYTTDS